MRYYTADTHFNHKLFSQLRDFHDLDAHDKFLISTWNSFVTRKDEVYHLGDFCFGDHATVRRIRAQLNGHIHLILGNHDHKNRIHNIPGLFSSVSDIKQITIEGNCVVLCHYAMRTWPSSHWNSWQLHGHSHGKLPSQGKQYDVGIDNTGYRFLADYDIVEIMKNKPDNINLIQSK